jgi:hypothetical protein
MSTEISGENLLYGDDIIGYDEIGAAAPARRLAPSANYPSGMGLRTTAPTRAREYVMGVDSVATIAAAATLAVAARPQVVFRPDRIVIPASIADAFIINDIKVGKNSQLAGGGAVPAAAFANTAVGVRLKLDTAQISQDILISVTNVSAGAVRFLAALIGPAVE